MRIANHGALADTGLPGSMYTNTFTIAEGAGEDFFYTPTTNQPGFVPGFGVTYHIISGAAATFSNKGVGTGKTVTIAGYALSGADAGNYNLTNATATTTADITRRALTVTQSSRRPGGSSRRRAHWTRPNSTRWRSGSPRCSATTSATRRRLLTSS